MKQTFSSLDKYYCTGYREHSTNLKHNTVKRLLLHTLLTAFLFTSCTKATDVHQRGEENSSVTFAISVADMKRNEIRGSYAGDYLTEPDSKIKSLRIMMFDFNSGELDIDYTLDYIEGQTEITRQLPYKGLTAGTTLKKHIVALANVKGESSNVSVIFPDEGINTYDDIKKIKIRMTGAIDKDQILPMAAQDDPVRGIEITTGDNNDISLTLERVVSRFGFTNVTPPGKDPISGDPISSKEIFTATKIELNNYTTEYTLFDTNAAPTLSTNTMQVELGDTENTVFYMLPTPKNDEPNKGLAVTVYGKAAGESIENVNHKFEIAQQPLGKFNGSIVRNCAYAMYVEYKRDIEFEGTPVEPEAPEEPESGTYTASYSMIHPID